MLMETMNYRFEGTLAARDCKRHIPHRFTLVVDSGQIDINLRFSPLKVHGYQNMITLSLFDPTGCRGAGHRSGDSHQVRISSDKATPGYLPGALPAGEWIVQIDTHMIMPGEPLDYTLDIAISQSSSAERRAAPSSCPPAVRLPMRGAGWYRGDLHSHTHHSDAGERTLPELLQAARAVGLDFIFLTDHNTMSGLAEMDASSSAELFTAGGIELTTFWGHALCLGAREWIDWRVHPGTGEMAQIASAAYARDQLFIIAHPQSIGDPECTGCRWRYGDMMPGTAHLVEIWNGPWAGDSRNEEALALWYDWLNQGRRLVATAGTDTHSNDDYAAQPGFNVIYSHSLSEAGLLRALRAGHLYLSSGPVLAVEAHSEQGERWIMGDSVAHPVTVSAAWAGCPSGAIVRVIENGRLLREWETGAQGSEAWHVTPEQVNWLVVEVRGENGDLLALTNPLFFVT